MKQFKNLLFIFICYALFLSSKTFAWDHSFEVGAGFSHDPNHTRYNNSGVLVSGDLIPLKRTPCYFWSIGGALGQWWTTTPNNKNLTTIAIPLSLRYYLPVQTTYPTYAFGSVGPAYLSSRKFGNNTQASNFTGQWNLGLGAEFDKIDVNLRLQHFSNAYLASPDQGFTILYLLSLGYLF